MLKKKNKLPFLLFLSIIFFSFFLLFLSFFPRIYEASLSDKVQPDRVMVWGEHVYTYDYNTYLSKILQGTEGRWNVVDKYDSNPNQKGAFLQMLYLLTGKIGGLLKLSPVLTYHLLVVLTSFFWILTIIFLNKYFLKKTNLIVVGTLLSLLASSFPLFFKHGGEIWIDHFMPWWQEIDVLKRLNYLPHYMVNYIALGILSILLSKLSKSKVQSSNVKSNPKFKVQIRKKSIFGFWILKLNWILDFEIWIFTLVCVILFFLFFIHPYGAVIFLFSWIIYHFLNLVWFKGDDRPNLRIIILSSLILLAVSFFPLLYLKSTTSTYPWSVLTDERWAYVSFNFKDYLLALGPILFSGLAGLISVFYYKERRLLPLATWFLGSLSGIVIFKFFPIMTFPRFIQSANHIPLAILSVYFFSVILKKFPNIFIKIMTFITVIMLISLGLVHVYFSLKRQTDFIRQRVFASIPLVPYPSQVMYPLKDFWNGIVWLSQNTKNDEAVLSKVTAGNYIPAYAGNFVHLGHFPESPDYFNREKIVNNFFQGNMTNPQAKNFLKKNYIKYIFYGPQEAENGKIEQYDFLNPVYKTFYVTIYKTN